MGENQHFLPRWLLRPFASRRQGERVYVQVHSRSGVEEQEIEVVGSEDDFYEVADLPRRTVEDALAALDGVHADLVRRGAKRGSVDPKVVSLLPRVFADLSLRTRNARRGLHQATDEMTKRTLEHVLSLPDETFIGQAFRTLGERDPALLKEAEGMLGREALGGVLKVMGMPLLRELMSGRVKEFRQSELADIIRAQHVKTLKEAIRARALRVYGDLGWRYVPSMEGGLVLGDCALVTYSLSEGRYLPPMELPLAGNEPRLHILPVAPAGAIVGTPPAAPDPDLEAVIAGLNRASARLSEEFFVAASRAHAGLCAEVGADQALWRSFPDPDRDSESG